jgi:hypothetical protein
VTLAIKRSQQDLPAAPQGRPPTLDRVVLDKFAEKWLTDLLASGYNESGLAIPEAGPFRASMAGKRCDRQLYYALIDADETEPNTVSSFWSFWNGTKIHDALQDTMRSLGDGWIPEINVDLNAIGIPGSGHADLVRFVDAEGNPWELIDTITWQENSDLELEEKQYVYLAGDEQVILNIGQWDPECMFPTHCAELKSINGTGFRIGATTDRGPATGPRFGAELQGILCAAALGLDEAIILNLSLEVANERYARDEIERFGAEWHVPTQPLAGIEARRIRRLMKLAEGKQLPARELHDPSLAPAGAVIIRPAAGTWVQNKPDGTVNQTGNAWLCGYCNHKSRCIADGDGVPVTLKAVPTPTEELRAELYIGPDSDGPAFIAEQEAGS